MRDRHITRACRACSAPMARQLDTCWRCGAPWATAAPQQRAKPSAVPLAAVAAARLDAAPLASTVGAATDGWDDDGGAA